MACQDTGAVGMHLMPDATQNSVVSILKLMEAKYGPITFISSDAGTQFEKSNFLGNNDEQRLFQQLEGVHTAQPRSQ